MGNKNNPLRGTGIKKLGWTEGAKMYSTNKRMLEGVDVEFKSKDKSKAITIICDCCKKKFKVRSGKVPKHTRIITNLEFIDDSYVRSYLTENCEGKALVVGKKFLSEYLIKFMIRSRYSFTNSECLIKPGDYVLCELYGGDIFEKRIKFISESISPYGKKTTSIECYDGTILERIKEIYIINK